MPEFDFGRQGDRAGDSAARACECVLRGRGRSAVVGGARACAEWRFQSSSGGRVCDRTAAMAGILRSRAGLKKRNLGLVGLGLGLGVWGSGLGLWDRAMGKESMVALSTSADTGVIVTRNSGWSWEGVLAIVADDDESMCGW